MRNNLNKQFKKPFNKGIFPLCYGVLQLRPCKYSSGLLRILPKAVTMQNAKHQGTQYSKATMVKVTVKKLLSLLKPKAANRQFSTHTFDNYSTHSFAFHPCIGPQEHLDEKDQGCLTPLL